MSTKIRFLGVAAFEVEGPSRRLLMDPFISGNPLAPVSHEELATPDLILVTHAAHDHLGDTLAIAQRTGAPVVCGADVRQLLLDGGLPSRQIQATVWGVAVRVNDIVVRPVECHHWSTATRKNGQFITGTPLAFIVESEPGVRIYHYGDTSYFDMSFIRELYAPTVGLLGCTQPREIESPIEQAGVELTGEMDPDEAARAAEVLGVDVAVACHYLTLNEDVTAFGERVAHHDTTGTRRVVLPRLGETFTVEPAASIGDAGQTAGAGTKEAR